MLSRQDPKKSLASRMRHYVDFQSLSETPDGEGGFTKVWSNITGATSIPVEILPIKALEKAEMRSKNIKATHYIRSRSNIPIEEIGRILFSTPGGDRYFYISTKEDIQTRDIVDFMIVEERRD